jgi:hypothetical protein
MSRPIQFDALARDCCESAGRFYAWDETLSVRPVEELEAIRVGNWTQSRDRVRGAALEDHVSGAALFKIEARELDRDQSEDRWRTFGNLGRMKLMLQSAHEIVENDPIFRIPRRWWRW